MKDSKVARIHPTLTDDLMPEKIAKKRVQRKEIVLTIFPAGGGLRIKRV
jgi:hypothetical protein